MYRIQYFDILQNQTEWYCGGLQFTKKEANAEIKLLKAEQKKFKVPTRKNFNRIKVEK